MKATLSYVCRAINYDEKDPFLCNACGFCKYAKFDLTLLAKPCCAVDPIENEEDRKKVRGNRPLALSLFVWFSRWLSVFLFLSVSLHLFVSEDRKKVRGNRPLELAVSLAAPPVCLTLLYTRAHSIFLFLHPYLSPPLLLSNFVCMPLCHSLCLSSSVCFPVYVFLSACLSICPSFIAHVGVFEPAFVRTGLQFL